MHNVAVMHTLLQTEKSTIVVLIDLLKAYNTVCHKLLLNKLSKVLPDSYLLLIQLFICNNILNAETGKIHITTELRGGLPQGVVISAILFNFFISNLFNIMECDENNTLLIFADDIIYLANSQEKAQLYCKKISK